MIVILRFNNVRILRFDNISLFALFIIEVLLGANGCTTAFGITDSCLVSDTDCDSSSTCVCKPGFYDDNGSDGAGRCAPSKLTLCLLGATFVVCQ